MGTKDRKHNNSEDGALFRATVGTTLPVKSKARHQEQQTIKAVARKRREHQRASPTVTDTDVPRLPLTAETGDTLSFKHTSVNNSTLKKLRRGQIAVEDAIDLHGMTVDKARLYLREFIHACRQSGCRCVRVVHGKGISSGPGGPVIKHAVNNWLQQWDDVIAFCSARPCDGGTGAVYVLLKK